MTAILSVLLIVALIGVVAVLATGLGAFATGGRFHKRNANRLMNLRVGVQAVALVILALLLLFGKGG